jgi:hypothetical protein
MAPTRGDTRSSSPLDAGRSVTSMIIANRPWQLVGDLSKVIVATLATAAFLVVNTNTWSIADQLSTLRLLAIGVLSIAALLLWLVVAHELFESPSRSQHTQLVRRANSATIGTLFIGLLLGYGVLFAMVLLAAALVVPAGLLESTLRHPAGFADYATVAWLSSSLATIAGAIGSGLESDEDVHNAIRRYRVDELSHQHDNA